MAGLCSKLPAQVQMAASPHQPILRELGSRMRNIFDPTISGLALVPRARELHLDADLTDGRHIRFQQSIVPPRPRRRHAGRYESLASARWDDQPSHGAAGRLGASWSTAAAFVHHPEDLHDYRRREKLVARGMAFETILHHGGPCVRNCTAWASYRDLYLCPSSQPQSPADFALIDAPREAVARWLSGSADRKDLARSGTADEPADQRPITIPVARGATVRNAG